MKNIYRSDVQIIFEFYWGFFLGLKVLYSKSIYIY